MQKTNFKTRLLALLTAVFMVIVSIPFAAFADDDEIMYIKYYANNGSKLASSTRAGKNILCWITCRIMTSLKARSWLAGPLLPIAARS